MEAKQVPLIEHLASVPADARLVIDDADGMGTRYIPVGRLCHEAAAAITALRERLAQPEQDVPEASCGNMGPVGWLESPDGVFRANPLYKIKFPSKLLSWQVPLYTAPPQRKPLTDNELADLWYKQSLDWLEFARAIEAAHGIKENT